MHKFFVTTVLAITTLAASSTISIAASTVNAHQCTLPNSKYIEEVGACVMMITDQASLEKQLDPATGKVIPYRMDYDPNCDGKPSGYIYQVPSRDPVTGLLGQEGRRCD